MKSLTKVKDSADEKGRGLWSTISSAVSGAFAEVSGRKRAERKRNRAAVAAAAGTAVAATGAAGVYLAKKKDREADTEEPAYAPPEAPAAGPNGSAASAVSSESGTSA
ncbi:hypothetical protein BH20ACT15_BH20ACT15_08170 [soil metagenome]